MSRPPACGSHCGAPSPTNAGTKSTPLVSGTLAANASTSAEEPMSLRLSRSHCTTAPPIKMLPSHKLRADVLQQKAAGAVGVFGFTRTPAELTEERGLLVARDAGNRNAAQAERRRNLADFLA